MATARPLGILASILAIISPAYAAGEDYRKGDTLLNIRIEQQSVIGRELHGYYKAGVSTLHFVDSRSLSSASVSADVDRFDVPVMAQSGSDHNDYSIAAESYYKLSPASTISGRATYRNGYIRDVSFSDVVDYQLVAPFVTGDDTGGKLSYQQYSFGGAWGRTLHDWTIGIEADYRAQTAHRAVDPRVKNTVSDLDISLGVGRKAGSDYLIGVNAGAKIYHQDSDVDFYNPVSHAITYVFTGLGSSSSRFKGADAQTASHRLLGFNATVQLVPVTGRNGFYATVSGEINSVDLILHGYRDLNFGSTTTRETNLRLSRLLSVNSLALFPTVNATFTNRSATENIFGSSDDNYVTIGKRKNYTHNICQLEAAIPAALQLSKATSISLDVRGAYVHDKEYLLQPERSLTTDYLRLSAAVDATQRFGAHLVGSANVGISGRSILSTSAIWGGLDLTSPEGEMTLRNYRMACCSATALSAGMSLSRAAGNIAVTLSLNYRHSDYRSQNNGDRIVSALSLIF